MAHRDDQTTTGGAGKEAQPRTLAEATAAQRDARAEEDSRRAAEARAVLAAVADAVLVYDSDGRVVRCNAAAERLLGYDGDERSMTLAERIASGRVAWVDEGGRALDATELPSLRAARAGETHRDVTLRMRRPDRERWVSLSAAPLVVGGRRLGAVVTLSDITAQKEAEAALRRSEADARAQAAQLEAILGCIGDGVVVYDAQGRTLRSTPAADELLGIPVGDRRAPVAERAERQYEVLDESGRRQTRDEMIAVRAAMHGETVRGAVLRIRPGTAAPRWLRMNAIPYVLDGRHAGAVLSMTDITERKRAEDALRESEGRLRAIFEDAAVGIVEVDEDDRFVDVNARVCEMLGYARQELLGRTLHDLTAPEDRALTRDLNARAHAGDLRVFRYEKRYLRRDGSRLWVHVNVSVVRDAQGRFVRAIGTVEDIAERKRAQDALRESEARFRSVFEQAAVGMGRVRFADARWIDVNGAFCEMLGRSRAEMLSAAWPEITHPEDLELDLVPFRRMAAGELDSYTVEKRFIHADGHPVWAKLTLSLVRDANGNPDYEVAIVEDIRDRKRAEEELRQSEERFRSVVENMSEGLMIFDASGNAVFQNAASLRILGVESGADGLFQHADLAARWRGWDSEGRPLRFEEWPISRVLRNEAFKDQIVHAERAGTGHRFDASYNGTPIRDEQGRLLYGFVTIRDITEQVRAREQEDRARAAERGASERLRDADRRKDEFLGMLSHELRNPLAPIRNSLFILDRAEPAGQQARRAREVASRQLGHLTRLVDDLLDVTRIARGKVELRRGELDLVALARRTADDHRALMQARHVELAVELRAASVLVHGDETRLAQVLGNLLHNAAKFTPAGGRVTLVVAAEGDSAVIRLRDTGPGIDPALLGSIFEPFTQAKQTLARSEGGLGLGLALVKGLVALHGGEVSASSAGPGQGAEFVVTIPLASRPAAVPGASDEGAAVAGARRRVLVIDDNRDAAESLADLVVLMGHEAVVAFDAFGGLGRAAEELPDVVLCDLGLPGMDGYEFARRFRAIASPRRVLLVAVSGYAHPEHVAKAIDAGFDAHVAKPPDPEIIAGLLCGDETVTDPGARRGRPMR